MMLSEAGLKFLKQAEGFRPCLYPDAGGWAIGYGCQVEPDVWRGVEITEDQATKLLCRRIAECEEAVAGAVTKPLSQCQFDALVIFTFNVGRSAFEGSTLVRRINLSKVQAAASEFDRWIFSQGRVCEPLRKRREKERGTFLGEPVEGYEAG